MAGSFSQCLQAVEHSPNPAQIESCLPAPGTYCSSSKPLLAACSLSAALLAAGIHGLPLLEILYAEP